MITFGKLTSAIKEIREHLNGDFFYQKYLQNFAKNHTTEKPLDKKTFLKNRQQSKWRSGINRCC